MDLPRAAQPRRDRGHRAAESGLGKEPSFRLDAIPLDDDETLAFAAPGDSIGVFQLEGGPCAPSCARWRPRASTTWRAWWRSTGPGPMAANMHNDYADRKNGRKPIQVPARRPRGAAADTQGLMIYQESVMRVAQKFAGYSLAEADNLRKACGKKIRELIAAEREKFVAGCERTGYGAEVGTKLFDIIEPFADYAFNKSHSYGYGFIAYQTAYLKAISRWSTSPACSRASRATSTGPPSTWPSAGP
jgi:DNA polymerase-3 subunit alpha